MPWVLDDAPPTAPTGGSWQLVDAPPQANPFNREIGTGNSFGSPLGPASPDPNQTDLTGEARAAMGGPITDRMVSGYQTYAPDILGGNDQDYSANLAANRQGTAEAQAAHPADALAGNIAGALPYAMLAPGGVAGGIASGGIAGAADSPDWSNLGQTGRDAMASALMGGAIGKGGEWLGAGLGKLAPATVDASVPTEETIAPMVKSAYQNVKNLGAAYDPDAFAAMVNGVKSDAAGASINPLIHPKSVAFLGTMGDMADAGQARAFDRSRPA